MRSPIAAPCSFGEVSKNWAEATRALARLATYAAPLAVNLAPGLFGADALAAWCAACRRVVVGGIGGGGCDLELHSLAWLCGA